MKKFQVPLKSRAEREPDPTLVALQYQFAQACNFVAAVALEHACFSRVRLHHLAYRAAREKFPELGSQLVSNSIYAVCRKYRELIGIASVTNLLFTEQSPVFFDRHTLSVKQSTLSMLTLDGRVKFQVPLSAEFLRLFQDSPLKEVELIRQDDKFYLVFCFKEALAQPSKVVETEELS